MRLLLDTHVWLWWRSDPKQLGARGKRLLEDARQKVLVSAASGLEISLKSGLGRFSASEPLRSYMPRALEQDGFEVLPISLDHTLRVSELPSHHGDPFDRLLVAQAQMEGLTLMTADAELTRYDVEVIWAGRKAARRPSTAARKAKKPSRQRKTKRKLRRAR